MMRAGQLRHHVTLQSQSLTDDLAGADNVAFTDVATLWAHVTTTGGREFWQAKQATPELTHQVEIRWRAGVLPGMRIIDGDAVFDIQSVQDPDGRRNRLLLMCTELVQEVVS